MEDLFQIIIIVIFILSSIVSSMNKKKKQQQKKKETKIPTQRNVKTSIPKKKQKTTAEILEEMLGLKIELPEPPKKEAPKSYSEDSQRNNSWDPTNDFKDYSEEQSLKRENQKQAYKAAETTDEKDKFRAFKEKKEKPVTVKTTPNKFQKLFADQSNLKNFIVIQEVLNKPKAFRR